MSSTELLDAPSISIRSGLVPPPMATQEVQVPQGFGVGPFSQFRALASALAAVVLPTPRAPQNR